MPIKTDYFLLLLTSVLGVEADDGIVNIHPFITKANWDSCDKLPLRYLI